MPKAKLCKPSSSSHTLLSCDPLGSQTSWHTLCVWATPHGTGVALTEHVADSAVSDTRLGSSTEIPLGLIQPVDDSTDSGNNEEGPYQTWPLQLWVLAAEQSLPTSSPAQKTYVFDIGMGFTHENYLESYH